MLAKTYGVAPQPKDYSTSSACVRSSSIAASPWATRKRRLEVGRDFVARACSTKPALATNRETNT